MSRPDFRSPETDQHKARVLSQGNFSVCFRRLGGCQCHIEGLRTFPQRSACRSISANSSQQILKFGKMYIFFTTDGLHSNRCFGSEMEQSLVCIGEFSG